MSQALRIKKLVKQVSKSIEDDLKLYKAKVFETRYFSHIQKYLSCIRKNPAIPTQKYNKERTAVSELDCAEMFNNFFSSVFNTTGTTHDAEFSRKAFNWFRINQSNVNELHQEINIRKSIGPDGIGNIMLEKTTDGISQPLTFVYRTIVNKSSFPTQRKLCHVCPVFTDGNKKDVSCYRKISVKSVNDLLFGLNRNAHRMYRSVSKYLWLIHILEDGVRLSSEGLKNLKKLFKQKILYKSYNVDKDNEGPKSVSPCGSREQPHLPLWTLQLLKVQ